MKEPGCSCVPTGCTKLLSCSSSQEGPCSTWPRRAKSLSLALSSPTFPKAAHAVLGVFRVFFAVQLTDAKAFAINR